MHNDTGIGKLYITGLGPGDSELITLKALNILKNIKTIYIPRAEIKKESLALKIVKPFLKDNNSIIEIVYPLKNKNEFWKEKVKEISFALKKEDAVFLTLGDPSIYSTSAYLCEYLKEEISEDRIEIIPGITSISISAALLKTSLVSGKERMALIPCPEDVEVIDSYIDLFDKIVIMKIGKKIDKLIKFLKDNNFDKSAAFVSKAGLPEKYLEKDMSNIDKEINGDLSIVIIDTRGRE